MSGTSVGDAVTLYLLAPAERAEQAATAMATLASDVRTQDTPLVVLCPAEAVPTLTQKLGATAARVVPVAAMDRRTTAEAVLRDLSHVTTPAFAAVRLPPPKHLGPLVKLLDKALHEDAGTVTPLERPSLPRLLVVDRTLPALPTLYAFERARGGEDLSLGEPARYVDLEELVRGVRLEAVDPGADGLRVTLWVNSGIPPELPRPTWRFEVLLTDGTGVRAASAPTPLSPRVDRFAHSRWDEVIADVPLRGVPDGEYVIAVRPVTEDGRDATVRGAGTPVGTRQGPLLCARATVVGPVDDAGTRVRYLVHTRGEGRRPLLLVQTRADAPGARRRWRRRLRTLDVEFISHPARHRRASALRLLRLLTRPLFARRRIWLIGERPDTAQDNGMHLFRHLRRTAPEREVYYVIDRESGQRERVEDLGNVIDHSSPRHRLYLLHAEVLANAYSIHHMLPKQWDAGQYARHLAWRVGALRVYLKHGVHLSPNAVKRGSAGSDLFLTATDGETDAVLAVTGYQPAQVVRTGLPRYDALLPTPPSRTVLFMSTWRRYLVARLFSVDEEADEEFTGSEYERFVGALLSSPRLHDILSRYDYAFEFLPHYHLAKAVSALPTGSDRVSVADPDAEAIQDTLRRCDVFITDYSSVHFDVAYMGTPVVYSRFDEADFESKHASPSWFDYDEQGFGPVARTLEETLDALEEILERGCTMAPEYAARANRAFVHRDQSNSARVQEVIDERLRSIDAG